MTARRTLRDAIELTAADDAAAGAELRGAGRVPRGASPGAGLAWRRRRSSPSTAICTWDRCCAVPTAWRSSTSMATRPRTPRRSRRTAPAARDVAAMRCSLDHVGRDRDPAGRARGHAWRRGSTRRWTRLPHDLPRGLAAAGQRGAARPAPARPFRVEQECRELLYAARFLPRWRYAPDGRHPCHGGLAMSDRPLPASSTTWWPSRLPWPGLRAVAHAPRRLPRRAPVSRARRAPGHGQRPGTRRRCAAARLRAAGLAAVAELASAEVGTVAGPGTLASRSPRRRAAWRRSRRWSAIAAGRAWSP